MDTQPIQSIVLLDYTSEDDFESKITHSIIRNHTNIDLKYFDISDKNIELTHGKVLSEALETVVKYKVGIILGPNLAAKMLEEIEADLNNLKSKKTKPLFKDWPSLLSFLGFESLSEQLAGCSSHEDLDKLNEQLSP